MSLMYSFFVVAFFLSLFFFLTYTYYGFVTKLTSSAVTHIYKSLIWKNVLFTCCMPLLNFSKALLQVIKRENDIMQ